MQFSCSTWKIKIRGGCQLQESSFWVRSSDRGVAWGRPCYPKYTGARRRTLGDTGCANEPHAGGPLPDTHLRPWLLRQGHTPCMRSERNARRQTALCRKDLDINLERRDLAEEWEVNVCNVAVSGPISSMSPVTFKGQSRTLLSGGQ
jgi:hypothetical protein